MIAQINEETEAELFGSSVAITQGEDTIVLTMQEASKLRIALEAFERKLEDKP